VVAPVLQRVFKALLVRVTELPVQIETLVFGVRVGTCGRAFTVMAIGVLTDDEQPLVIVRTE
jgi:hypothetical protein